MKAVIFPGQGAQYVGMGRSFYDNFSSAQEIFKMVDEILGWKLSKLCFEGPSDELKRTFIQQLAILTVSLAAYEVFKREKIKIDFLSGLSVGECYCLYPAGVLNLKDLVYFVKMRGEAMEEASYVNPSSLFAVMGLEKQRLEQISKKEGFYLANINSSQQIAISLKKEERERIKSVLESYGAKIVELMVSGGFHSPFMEPAKKQFKKAADSLEFKPAKVSIVSNVTARAHTDKDEIKNNLIEQLVSPVLWKSCVEFMVKKGVDIFFEIGPSRILHGLIRKIDPRVKVINIEKKEDIDNLSHFLSF